MRRLVSAVRQARRLLRMEQPILLMYHRVAELCLDPWELSVSPGHFADQTEVLRDERQVVPLPWLLRKLREGKTPRRTVAITFDDGYADVLGNAKPILERHDCPATVFLATGAIGDPDGFWWDILSRIIFDTAILPDLLALDVMGRRHEWILAANSDRAAPPGVIGRPKLSLDLWHILRLLDPPARRIQLERLAAWASTDAMPRNFDRTLTLDEVRQLSCPGFIDMGAHTVSHPSLPALDGREKLREIAESRGACEDMSGAPVQGFAYPFGDCDAASIGAVKEAGFAFACATQAGTVTTSSDVYRLARVSVADWNASDFRKNVLRFG